MSDFLGFVSSAASASALKLNRENPDPSALQLLTTITTAELASPSYPRATFGTKPCPCGLHC